MATATIGDDICTSTLLPLTFQSSFGKTTIQPDGSVVSSGSFDQVLSNAGFTNSNGWTINYAIFSLPYSGTLGVNMYDAWVGDPPTNPGLDGKSRKISPPPGSQWPRECAGATIQIEAITGTPVTGLHFIQMYTEGFNSNNPPNTKLDNPSPGSPYYDQGGVAFTNVQMSDGNFGSWFQDTPYQPETELLDPYWNIPLTWTARFDFAIVTTSAGPNNTNELTIWGGYEWGFKATIVETPEPPTLTLFAFAAVCILGYGWRSRAQAAWAGVSGITERGHSNFAAEAKRISHLIIRVSRI